MLEYKRKILGKDLIKVPAYNSSRECNICGQIDVKSREGRKFRCTFCGNEDDADRNAAKNIYERWLRIINGKEFNS